MYTWAVQKMRRSIDRLQRERGRREGKEKKSLYKEEKEKTHHAKTHCLIVMLSKSAGVHHTAQAEHLQKAVTRKRKSESLTTTTPQGARQMKRRKEGNSATEKRQQRFFPLRKKKNRNKPYRRVDVLDVSLRCLPLLLLLLGYLTSLRAVERGVRRCQERTREERKKKKKLRRGRRRRHLGLGVDTGERRS